MDEITWSDFKKMSAQDIRKAGSFIVTYDGDYLAHVIPARGDHIYDMASTYGNLNNLIDIPEDDDAE